MDNYTRLKKIFKTRLHPLWLNRTMKTEANEVFYSYNEFRLSGRKEWSEAFSFLHSTGSNIRFIRHLAVHIPFEAIDHTAFATGNKAEGLINEQLDGSDQGLRRIFLYGTGLHIGLEDCLKMLKAAQNFQALKLILPSEYGIRDYAIPLDTVSEILGLSGPLHRTKTVGDQWLKRWHILETLNSIHPKLQITLLKLKRHPAWPSTTLIGDGICPGDPLNHRPIMFRAAKNNWKTEEQYYDAKGHYPVGPEDKEVEEDEEGNIRAPPSRSSAL